MGIEKEVNILLVDDDTDHIMLTKEVLEEYDPIFKIDVAVSGDDCLERLAMMDYDAVLLDYFLPVINGIEVLGRINKHGYKTPVIIVTGHGDERIAVRAMKKGAYDYIIKSSNYLKMIPSVVSKTIKKRLLDNEKKRLEEQLIQSEKLAGIGTLASGIAHEINNMLLGISGSAEIIRNTKDLNIAKKYAKDILKLSGRITDIIKDLSQYSKAVHDNKISSVSINDMIEESLKLVELFPISVDINIVRDYKASSIVKANYIEMMQVFVNIIINAFDAMRDNDTLTIVTHEEDSRFAEIEVRDTGYGIPGEYIENIFDPFFTTKGPGRGTGLGLSITRRIVERHGGTIKVESEVNRGAAFIIRLPIGT